MIRKFTIYNVKFTIILIAAVFVMFAAPATASALVTPSCDYPGWYWTVNPNNVTFRWGSVSGASVYDFRLWNYTPWSETNIVNGLTGTSYGPINLAWESSYAYRVSARNSGEIGPWATCYFYTPPPPPAVTVNSSCTSADTGNLVTVSWTNTSVSYVDISTDPNFGGWWYKPVGGTSTNASSGFGNLTFQPNTTYYARTWNGSRHSGTRQFTTPKGCPPPQPTGLSGSCPVPGTSAPLSWNAASGATTYNVFVSTTGHAYDWNTCSSPNICVPVGNVTSYNFPNLSPGTSYQWYVASCNNYSCGNAVSGSNFTCIPMPPPPTASISSPANNSSTTVGQNIPVNAIANGTNLKSMDVYRAPATSNLTLGSSWTRIDGNSNCGGNSSCSVNSSWTPTAGETGQWKIAVNAFDNYGQNCDGMGTGSNPPWSAHCNRNGSVSNVTVNVIPPAPTCTEAHPSAATTTATSGSFRVYATGVQNATEVNFPTWSEVNGQDDIIWYPGTNSGGGTWYADIDLARHLGLGWIRTHTYLYNSGYINQWCDTADFQRILPPAPTSPAGSCPIPGTTASLNWTGNSSASRYDVFVFDTTVSSVIEWKPKTADYPQGVNCGEGNRVVCQPVNNGTSYSFSTTPGHNYQWFVFACNNYGCSTTPASYSTTFSCIPMPAAPTASISSPANNSSATVDLSISVSATANGTNLKSMDIYRARKDSDLTQSSSWTKIDSKSCSGSSCSLNTAWTPAVGEVDQWVIAVNAFDAYDQRCSGMQSSGGYWTAWCGRNGSISNVTVNVVPPAPTNPAGSCPAPGTTANLSWTGVSGASRYDVFVQDLAYGSLNWSTAQCGQNGLVVCQQVTNGTSYSFSTTPGKNYQWYVFACGNGGCNSSPASYSTSFICTATPTPPTPSISTGPTCTPTDTASMYTISWASASPAVTYVDISTDPNFASFYNKNVSGTSTSATSGFNLYPGGSSPLTLQPNTTYYVRSWNGHANSSSASFTTPNICLGTPSCNSPSSNSTVNPDNVTFSWGPVPGASVYDFRLWNYTPWSETNIINGLTGTSYGPLNLSSGSNYAYRVSARNSGEIGPWATCSFSTSPPPTAAITAPGNNSSFTVGQAIPVSATANGTNLNKIEIWRSLKTSESWTLVATGSCSGSSCSLTGSWTPASTETGPWYVAVNAYDAYSQKCSGNPFNNHLHNGWSVCGTNDNITVTVNPASTPTPVAATNCGGGAPARAEGLVTTPTLQTGSKFGTSTTGRCAVNDSTIEFKPFKIPTYDYLKSLYHAQTKSTKTEITPPSGAATQGTLRSALNSYSTVLIKGNLDINTNLGGIPKPAVVFVDGNLSFSGATFTFGDANSGIVFVVGGNVIINQSVTQIDAVIISSGTIYTAGAGCTTNSSNPTTTSPLIVNGSLISLDPGAIVFCRILNNNSQPAEKINHQVKYLVILKDLYADTIQKWSEIP